MNCPVCGYVRSPFDAECPRCKRLAPKGLPRHIMRPAEETVMVPELSAANLGRPRSFSASTVTVLVLLALMGGMLIGHLLTLQIFLHMNGSAITPSAAAAPAAAPASRAADVAPGSLFHS